MHCAWSICEVIAGTWFCLVFSWGGTAARDRPRRLVRQVGAQLSQRQVLVVAYCLQLT